jgi:hypothetical protein
MPTLDDLAKVAYITYTGPIAPNYGPNDSSAIWDKMAPENKVRWEKVVKEVVTAAMK